MELTSNPAVESVFNQYSAEGQKKARQLRKLIIEAAKKSDGISTLEETLKWGEPSYISNIGSTIRLGWQESDPTHCRLYFICNTKLVDTFKEIYGDTLTYDANRALVFDLKQALPQQEIKQCCQMALRYHKIKHLPLLGA